MRPRQWALLICCLMAFCWGGSCRKTEVNTDALAAGQEVAEPEPNLWPEGAGYLIKPAHKPGRPHSVIPTTETRVVIIGMKDDMMVMGRGSRIVGDMVHPGAVIINNCEDPPSITLIDFNGDECVVPYGMTVRVNEYGMFEPVLEPEEPEPPEEQPGNSVE